MPIAFSCPHCGKATTVADQYAGQSGPCAACGRTITIPHASAYPAVSPPAAAAAGGGIAMALIIGLIAIAGGLVVCGGILVALLLPAVQQTRGAARRVHSANNMKQIVIALHNYHDTYKQFPPAVVKDADGKPMYSGMVLLLPFVEQLHVFNQFDQNKPWDAPENMHLSQMDLAIFKNPSAAPGPAGKTDYLFVGGPQSLLGADGRRSLANCTDGSTNTMVLVEVKGNSQSWAAPAVWTPDQPLDSDTVNAVNVGMADGSVRALPKSFPQEQLRLLADPRDGNRINLE